MTMFEKSWNILLKTKTSHFLLNDAMFQRCFEKKNIDLDAFDNVWKNQNIS